MYSILFLTKNSHIIQAVNRFIEEWNDEKQTLIVKTSGSTGKPKEITLKKELMKNSALASGRFFNFQSGQRVRLALSISTIGGKMLLLRGMLHNMVIEIVEPSKNPLQVVSNPIDFISLVPYQLEYIIDNQSDVLSSIKTILLGGAPVSQSLKLKIQQLQNNVFLGFGMTETMSHVALMDLKKDETYHALDNVFFSKDQDNRLIIHAEMLGISSLLTNDVVDLKSSTSFQWLGRYDFVINSAGVKIHPEIIEKALAKVIAERFFIIGEQDDTFGERVVLIIEGKERHHIPFDTVLTKYEIPKKVYFIERFEETTSGKINRILTKNKIDATKS